MRELKTVCLAVIIGVVLMYATYLFAGVTLTDYHLYQISENLQIHRYTLLANSTGVVELKYPAEGCITHMAIIPGATSPSANTEVELISGSMTGYDLMGGASVLASTSGIDVNQPYVDSNYQWSHPTRGTPSAYVKSNTKPNATFDIEFGVAK